MRILLVEDDAGFAKAMCAFLVAKGFVVEHVCDVQSAKSMLPLASWDAVLLDWNLPDGEGLDLFAHTRKYATKASVIMLTARDQITDRIRGLDAGADDFLVKPFDPEELLARLRAVERRRSGATSAIVLAGNMAIDLGHSTVHINGVQIELTAKEWCLLNVLAARPNRVQSKEALSNALYSFNDEVGSNTLEVFISHLRRKLGRERIETLRGLGYRLNADRA
jgi:two-component system, OmpR family, response regulator